MLSFCTLFLFQAAYAPVAMPAMLPPSSIPQFITTQPQATQLAYPPTISVSFSLSNFLHRLYSSQLLYDSQRMFHTALSF